MVDSLANRASSANDVESSDADAVAPTTRAPGSTASGNVPAFYGRRRKRGTEICQILIANGDVAPEHVRAALQQQEESGGQIGQILVHMGVLSRTALARALLQQLQGRRAQQADIPSLAARQNPAIAGLKVQCRPLLTTCALFASDWVALCASVGALMAVDALAHGRAGVGSLVIAMPVLVVCVAALGAWGLYSALAQSPPDEIRSSTTALTFVFASGAVMAMVTHAAPWSVAGAIAWYVAAIFLVPILRALVRKRYAAKAWWGHPAVVIGAGKAGRMTVRTLRAQPSFGLKPAMILDDDRTKHGTLRAHLKGESIEVKSVTQQTKDLVTPSTRLKTSDLLDANAATSGAAALREQAQGAPEATHIESGTAFKPAAAPPRARGMFAEVEGVPVVGDFALAPVLAERLGISYAIVAMPGHGGEQLVQLAEQIGGAFSHLLVIPDLFGFASLGVPARDVGGVLGIEVRQQLMLPGPRFAKRFMDVALTSLGALVVLPIILLLALAIKIDSRGPVFYFQERVGRDGTKFRAYKFRSMHGDGEARLKAVLDADPKMRAEYEEFHKLSNDPRVTRVGRIVRKYSLDELPQLWNVLRGEMSLVGPRPYLEREIPQMHGKEGIILRAMPGVTGLWQVSDRNSTAFAARLKMDVHYVRNWSPWLDIYVLARTIGVVLKGTGV